VIYIVDESHFIHSFLILNPKPLVQDDPTLLNDGREVPQPNGLVAGSIPCACKFDTLCEINLST